MGSAFLVLVRHEPDLPGYWAGELCALLVISLLLSAFLAFRASTPKTVLIVLALRFIPLAAIALPEAASLGLVACLFSAYLVEIVCFVPTPFNRLLAATALPLAFVLELPLTAWGRSMERLDAPRTLSVIVLAAIAGIIADRCRKWEEENLGLRTRIRRLDETVLQLTDANMGYQRYAESIQEKSIAEERNRITRDIHDTVGYSLINIIMMMTDASLHSKDNPVLNGLHEKVREQAQAGLNETRRALHLLRTAEYPPIHTVEQVRRLTAAFEAATGITVTVEYGNIPFSLSGELGRFIIHMLKEGMANSLRHGKASHVSILFWHNDTELIITLYDNGSGSPTIEDGIGFAGMKERVAALGGVFSAHNIPDGFQIVARVPCRFEERTR